MAVLTDIFQTGLEAIVTRVVENRWTELIDDTYELSLIQDYYLSDDDPHLQTHWKYRGQSAVCLNNAGTVVIRLRIGTAGDFTDRNLYLQDVPVANVLDPDEWDWSINETLIYGTHDPWYAVACYPDAGAGSGYRTVSANATGIYVDDTLKLTIAGVIKIKPVVGKTGAIWFATAHGTDADSAYMDWHYCDNINATTPTSVADKFNNKWYHEEIASFWDSTLDEEWRIRSCPYGSNPRDLLKSDAVFLDPIDWANRMSTGTADLGTFYRIQASSGRAGTRIIANTSILQSGIYYFLYYTEYDTDESFRALSNIPAQAFYSICTDPRVGWSEPAPVGYDMWGLAGGLKIGDDLFLFANARVLHRLQAPGDEEAVDISNFVTEAELNVEGDNQRSAGQLTCANLNNACGALIGYVPNEDTSDILTDAVGSPMRIRIGQKRPNEVDYTWGEPNGWWIKHLNRVNTNEKQQLIISIEDMWAKLQTDYRTSYYFPGAINSHDWVEGGQNSKDNYFVPESKRTASIVAGPSDLFPVAIQLPNRRKYIDTRWRLIDGDVSIHFLHSGTPAQGSIIFRYIDPGNYWQARYSTTGDIDVFKYVNGAQKASLSDTASSGDTDYVLRVIFRGNWIRVYKDGTLVLDDDMSIGNFPPWTPGFVGALEGAATGTIYDMQIDNYEEPLTTGTIVRKALCHAGYFEHSVDPHLDDEEQIEITMGPQTDISDPSKMLERVRETGSAETVWDSITETIMVWQFEGRADTVQYVIEDEIIESDSREQAELKPSIILVDGNEHSWTEYLQQDILTRDWRVGKYFDLPELKSQASVRNRALIEAGYGARSFSPGGTCVYRTYFNRMDHVQWIDPKHGFNHEGRIASMRISIDQGTDPKQNVEIGLEPILFCPEILIPTFGALDHFNEVVATGLGDAEIGGTWTTMTAARWEKDGDRARVKAANATPELAHLGSVSDTAWKMQAKFLPNPNFSGKYQTAYEWGLVLRRTSNTDWHAVALRFTQNHTIKLIVLTSDTGDGISVWKSIDLPWRQRADAEQYFWLKAEIFGTNSTYVRVKAWKDGKVEPLSWDIATACRDSSGNDSGPQVAGSPGIFTRQLVTGAPTVYCSVDTFEVITAEDVI